MLIKQDSNQCVVMHVSPLAPGNVLNRFHFLQKISKITDDKIVEVHSVVQFEFLVVT